MAAPNYYYNKANEYITNFIDIKSTFQDNNFSSLDHLAEFIIDSIDTIPAATDEEHDKERDQLTKEVYTLLNNEYKAEIDAAIIARG